MSESTPPPPPPLPHSPFPIPLIIDSDPGIDDTLALLLALASPELVVRGISVSYGNTVIENSYRNCVEILRRAGRRLPIAVGARRPMKRALAVALETHGETGLGHAPVPPAGVILDYVKPLDRLLAEQPDAITLVTLGPVTSLALALRRDPALVRAKVRRHLAMIGNLNAAGNTNRYAEFNAWCDPEALDVVLAAGLPTELVGLDVTRSIVLTGDEIGRLGQVDDPDARWLHAALEFYRAFHKKHEGLDGCVVNDVLPIAALVRPEALTFQALRLVVDFEPADTRGRTRVDPKGGGAGHAAHVATAVQAAPVRQLLFERVLPWLSPVAA